MVDAAAQRAAVPGVDQSNVSGACTGMVGCRPDTGCHALKRTPATASPDRPVAVIGIRRPLQVTTWRPSTKPVALTCSRSTEEST